ncbi:hypothetical protein E8E12_011375 [Didymella heteroderae]|uniref:Uncharacterized protein n=1 Tax=Didymella heteroderae TaxID=1769908 RepID=A0A9P5C5Q0_9PLEO|nr:hypothetical protein E8E12_011375 [Didymella heteroderae]
MGGHAFEGLHCPRLPPDIYARVKNIATFALQAVFTHITVSFEVPGKVDFGDIDFLVSAPFGDSTELTLTAFPFQPVTEAIKHALNTTNGRRGFLTPDCMYFAIPLRSKIPITCIDAKDDEGKQESWVQIDVKICFRSEMFSWMTFELNFASQSSILGSMIKPLGLTLDPEGLHIRVEEMEATDWAGSMIWVTKDPWLVCRVLGIWRRVVDGGFRSNEEIYEEYAGSWLSHPENFRAKLEDESYMVQHSHRAHFLRSLDSAYPTSRQGVEERKLRELVTAAIPTDADGWSDDSDLPPVVIRHLLHHDELTPPPSPIYQPADRSTSSSDLDIPYSDLQDTPVHIDALPRQPPYPCKAGPPPNSMSAAARLACLSRWTAFSPTGTPYLLISPHVKDFDLQWRCAIEAGFNEEGLVKWAQDVWWSVWVRQCVVNWRGMWAKRFEKENAEAEKANKAEEEKAASDKIEEEARVKAEELVRLHKQKIMGRLEGLNRALGRIGVHE